MTALHVPGRIVVRKDPEHATAAKGRRTVESAHVAKAVRATIDPDPNGHVVRGKVEDRVTALQSPVREASALRIGKSGHVVKVGHAKRSGDPIGPADRVKVAAQHGWSALLRVKKDPSVRTLVAVNGLRRSGLENVRRNSFATGGHRHVRHVPPVMLARNADLKADPNAPDQRAKSAATASVTPAPNATWAVGRIAPASAGRGPKRDPATE